MSFHVRFRFRRLPMLTMTVAAFASMAMATPTTITWNDAGPVFATGTNWTGGLVPGAGDIVEFSTTDPIHNQPVIGAATSVAGLVFGNGAGAFTLSGAGPLTIGDSGITNCSTTIGQTIAVPLILAGSDYQWIKNDGTLTISSAITNDTGSGLKLAGPGTGGTVSGVISGSKDVIKYDGGTWTLSGANTFTGKLLVEAGVLNLAGTTVAPRVEVSGGATLNLDAANTLAATAEVYVYGLGTLKVKQSQTVATLESGTSGAQASVAVDSGATLTINAPDDNVETFEGVISGAGSVAKTGLGRQIFSGANTYTGTTTVAGGTLEVTQLANGGTASGLGASAAGAGNLVLNGGTLRYDGATDVSTDRLFTLGANGGAIDTTNGGALTFSSTGNIAFGTANVDVALTLNSGSAVTSTFNPVLTNNGAGKTSLRKNGVGTWVLGSANTFTGDTNVDYGTLALGHSLALQNSTVFVGNTGGLAFKGITSATLGALSGSQAIALQNDAGTPAAVALTVGGNGVSANYSGVLSAAGSLTKIGTGSLTLGGTNTYSGGTSLNGGTLVVDNDSNLGDAAGGLTFNGGTLQAASGFSSARGVTLSGGGGTIDTHAFQLTFSGVITGAGKLTHQGTGVLTLSGANNYAGGTVVKGGGVLDFTSNANLGTGGVELTGGFLRTQAAVADFSHDILLGSGGGNINTNGFNSTFSGKFTGAGGLTVQSQTGNGVLTLTNSGNQYAGATVINSGTLKVGATNALPTDNAVTISSGATLDVSENQTLATLTGPGGTTVANAKKLTIAGMGPTMYNGAISGSGGLERNGTGTLTLNGPNSYTGDTWVTAGQLEDGMTGAFSSNSTMRVKSGATLQVTFNETLAGLDDYAAGSSGTLSVGNSAVLTIANGVANTFTGTLSGAGSLTKTGAGELTLAGTSTYNGAVNVSGGTLTVGAANAFTADAVAVNNSAVFNVANSTGVGALSGTGTTTVAANQTLTIKKPAAAFGAVVGGAGGVTFANSNNSNGFTTLTTSQTYTGTTTLTTGSLQLGNGTAPVSLAGPVVLGSGSTLGFSHGSGNSTHSQPISGGGSLMKNNSGTLTLTGTNSYTGSTTVAGGTLKAGAANALPSGTGLSLSAGTTLDVAASQTINRFLTTDATSSILLEAGQSLTVALGGNPGSGTQFNGTISGAGGLKISDAGGFTVALTGDNTYTGGTTIDANAGLWIGSGGTKGLIAGNVVNNGTLLFARADKVTFGGVISGSGVVKQTVGSGTLEFTAANTYSGGTMLYAWLLAKNVSGSATGTGSVAVYSGGMLGGNGTVSGPVSINSGGTVGPGTALGIPAELHVGNTTFASGGVFAFQIKDATGSAGSDYSLLSSSGALTISATLGNPFTISVYSVNGSTQGTTANFDSTVGYSWTFVSAANGITGFDAAAFQVSTANFQNAFTGSFGISQAGNSLLLNYTPAAVPEPATWALLGLGLGGVWWWRRRGGRAGSGR